jgi:predicted dehydrogenase
MGSKKTNEIIRVAVIAAGMRGSHLAQQLAYCMQPAQVVAVAEPDDKRRRSFAQAHDLANGAQFTSWEDLFNSDLVFDAAIVATLDNLHTAPVLACLHRGCHVLVEKPLANTLQDCLLIEEAQRQAGVIVSVCHTLRYMEAFRRIKQIVQDGLIGRLIHVEHMEAIGHMRFTHNYVRGRWAKEANNTFLLLHKCSHDIDFVAWLVNEPCSRVSSFGSLGYFKPSQAPKGSGKRCLDGCLILDTCPYSALRLYVDGDLTDRIQDLGDTSTREDRLEVVRRGPFGACVWQADNDVVDHQIVSMEFASGTTATCTMTGYSATHGRRTRLQGSEGELLFDEALGSVTIRKFSNPNPEIIPIQPPDSYHPEDREIVANWLSAIHDSSNGVMVNAQEATKTHAIVFAAERSRKEKRTIEMSEHKN